MSSTSRHPFHCGEHVSLSSEVGVSIGVVVARVIIAEARVDEMGNVLPEVQLFRVRWDDNILRDHTAAELVSMRQMMEMERGFDEYLAEQEDEDDDYE